MPPIDPAATRTMVVALVHGAEPLVGPYRARLDPTTRRGLGAHVTLVHPFLAPGDVTDGVVAATASALAPVAPFPCTFGALRWFFDRVLWLTPEPATPFADIAGRIRDTVSGVAPPDRDLVPHLTVGLRRSRVSVDDLRDAASALAGSLPLITRIDAVQVMARAATWEVVAEVPLGGVSPSGPSGRGCRGSPGAPLRG